MLKLNKVLYQVEVEVAEHADASLIKELEGFFNAVAVADPRIKGIKVKSFPSYTAPYVQPETEDDANVDSAGDTTEPESV